MTERQLTNLLYDLQLCRQHDQYDVFGFLVEHGIHSTDFNIASGSSKLCLIFKDLPFVVKWSHGDYYVDEAVEEFRLYEQAKKMGLDCFFPTTEILCKVNHTTFVKQQKISYSVPATEGKSIEKKLQKIGMTASERIVEKMDKGFSTADGFRRHVSRIWAKAALVIYGKRKCKALCEFVIANSINDLHDNNLGFIGINPIILDFSGFHRMDDYSSSSLQFLSSDNASDYEDSWGTL